MKNELNLEKIPEIPGWYHKSKTLLYVSFALLLFSFFSPILFTQISSGISFENATNIGDTISIMNPFISLIGVVLTFLAFKIQYEANQNQIKIFNTELKNTKKIELKKNFDLQKENLEMLLFDLKEFIENLKRNIELINNFNAYSDETVFNIQPIQRTPPFLFQNIFQNDRKLLYQYLKNVKGQNENNLVWIKNYRNLYAIVGQIPEFLNDIYERSDYMCEKSNKFFISTVNELRSIYQEIVYLHNAIKTNLNYPDFLIILDNFLVSYGKIVEKPRDLKQNSDIITLKNLLSELNISLQNFCHYQRYLELIPLVTKINDIVVKINSFENDIKRFKDKLSTQISGTFYDEDSSLDKLEEIEKWFLKIRTEENN